MVTMLAEAMRTAAKELDFEKAAALRDRIEDLKGQWGIGLAGAPRGKEE
jgi:excinuclease UvrABC helicase subunit UvrB